MNQEIGVAFSGGGIRSAAYSYGALKILEKENQLEKFKYISTVSGGGYFYLQMYNKKSKLPALNANNFEAFNENRIKSTNPIAVSLCALILFFICMGIQASSIISIFANFLENITLPIAITTLIIFVVVIFYMKKTDQNNGEEKVGLYTSLVAAIIISALFAIIFKLIINSFPWWVTALVALMVLSFPILLNKIETAKSSESYYELYTFLKHYPGIKFILLSVPFIFLAVLITQSIVRSISIEYFVSSIVFSYIYVLIYIFRSADNLSAFKAYRDSLTSFFQNQDSNNEQTTFPMPLISCTSIYYGTRHYVCIDPGIITIINPEKNTKGEMISYTGSIENMNTDAQNIINQMTLSGAAIDPNYIAGDSFLKKILRALMPSLGLFVKNPCYKESKIKASEWRHPTKAYPMLNRLFGKRTTIDKEPSIRLADGGFF